MTHSTRRRRTRQIETLRTQFAQSEGLPFADLLTAPRLEQALRDEGARWREAIWTPVLTLWAFLSQIARLVVVFCLACGTVLDAALGRYQGKQQGENAQLRTLEQALEPGDVLLADRYYSGWFDLAWWRQRGVDVVVRLHQRRRCDLR